MSKSQRDRRCALFISLYMCNNMGLKTGHGVIHYTQIIIILTLEVQRSNNANLLTISTLNLQTKINDTLDLNVLFIDSLQ